MFDWLDPVGSVANKSLGIPKTGVTTSADPSNIGEMIASRIPGASGGSISQDFMNMNTGKGETEEERKKRLAEQAASRSQGMKKGGKVKAKSKPHTPKVSSASKRADGIATKGKTRGRIV
jgi:hypothetical protein